MHKAQEILPSALPEAQSEMVALFVSDVHLHPSVPRTTDAFLHFLQHHAIQVKQLYLLGDLFEYWAGDDDIVTSYNKKIIDAIRVLNDFNVAIFWLAGNRDFLIGEGFAKITGATLLPDPFVADIAGQRIALTHGDAQCTDDLAYMAFREKVRQPSWQREFLTMPLAQRKAVIENMRSGSREAQREKSYEVMDVNADAVASLFNATQTSIIIHGHTHRPARHEYAHNGSHQVRYVLSDWDCDHEVARGGWLAVDTAGVIKKFDVNGNEQQEN